MSMYRLKSFTEDHSQMIATCLIPFIRIAPFDKTVVLAVLKISYGLLLAISIFRNPRIYILFRIMLQGLGAIGCA